MSAEPGDNSVWPGENSGVITNFHLTPSLFWPFLMKPVLAFINKLAFEKRIIFLESKSKFALNSLNCHFRISFKLLCWKSGRNITNCMIFTFRLRKFIKISKLVLYCIHIFSMKTWNWYENGKLSYRSKSFLLSKYVISFSIAIVNARTGPLKNGLNFDCDKPKKCYRNRNFDHF